MRIDYIANARIPTEKAHGVQIMNMCAAFADAGAAVGLVVPTRRNSIAEDPFSYYGLTPSFKVVRLRVPDLVDGGPVGVWFQEFLFAARVALRVATCDVIYTRDVLSALFLSVHGAEVFYEMHDFPARWHFLNRLACRRAAGIVTTSRWIADQVVTRYGISEEKVLVCPNGADMRKFSLDLSAQAARRRLGIPGEGRIALYSGHLYGWKGADVLAAAAAFLPDNVSVYFVGGTPEDIVSFSRRYSSRRIRVVGQQPHEQIPLYLQAADVLVLPNVPISRHSLYSTSPIKLFEYMASGRPIVASDLPSIREIVDNRTAVLVPAGDAKALAGAIERLLGDSVRAEVLAQAARRAVQEYSWGKRAERILDFIGRRARLRHNPVCA